MRRMISNAGCFASDESSTLCKGWIDAAQSLSLRHILLKSCRSLPLSGDREKCGGDRRPDDTVGPVATCVGIGWRVFGRHEAIRSCSEVNDLIVWFLGEGLPSVDLAHGDLS